MKHFFSDWDVRLVVTSQAKQWLFQEEEKFISFLKEVDIYIGDPIFFNGGALGCFKPSVVCVPVPGFVYAGTRPDCVWMPGVASPLGGGILQSRIAVSAYCAGKSIDETEALFNAAHFERTGYFRSHEKARGTIMDAWAGIDIDFTHLFQTWFEEGDFMYTPNHPSGSVLYDILRATLQSRDLLRGISKQDLDDMRSKLDDPLSRGPLWPVYPELAEQLNVRSPITNWRGSIALGAAQDFDLREMLIRSFAVFDTVHDIYNRAEAALGGKNLQVYSGDASPNKKVDDNFELTFFQRFSPRRAMYRVRCAIHSKR